MTLLESERSFPHRFDLSLLPDRVKAMRIAKSIGFRIGDSFVAV